MAQNRPDTIGVGSYVCQPFTVLDWNPTDRKVHVGKYSCIAADVTVLLGGYHPIQNVACHCLDYVDPVGKGDVVIGSDVWIGHGATILSGITIGDGAVVAARAVVSRSIQPYALVAGNPARFKKWRFSPDAIRRLLEIRWWDWTTERIMAARQYLCQPDVNQFFAAYDEGKLT